VNRARTGPETNCSRRIRAVRSATIRTCEAGPTPGPHVLLIRRTFLLAKRSRTSITERNSGKRVVFTPRGVAASTVYFQVYEIPVGADVGRFF